MVSRLLRLRRPRLRSVLARAAPPGQFGLPLLHLSVCPQLRWPCLGAHLASPASWPRRAGCGPAVSQQRPGGHPGARAEEGTIGWSRRLGSRFNHLLPVGMGRPQAATARRWHLCARPGYHRRLTTSTVQEGVTRLPPGRLSFAGASIGESGLPVSDREALCSRPGNGPVVVVYSRSAGDGGQRSCTRSASPVRRASCSGSIVRPQALQILPGRGRGDLQPAAGHVRCSRVCE